MSQTLFQFAQQSGSHAVGLKVVEQYDFSRVFQGPLDALGAQYRGERARPLQTLVWYPAETTPQRTMTVGDYVQLSIGEIDFGKSRLTARAREWMNGMRESLSSSLRAVRDAPACAGAHPIVIYAPGLANSAWDNADLCEYLASYGYLVIASPSLGTVSRAPSHDLEGIEPQARDISFLIGYACSLEHADASRCAVIGFSWGGISNVVAAARDQRINALVCLDGSVRFSPGLVWKAGVAPHQMTIPLLSISQGQWSPEEKAALLKSLPGHEGPDVLNAWTQGDLTTVLLLGFGHGDHSSMAQRNEDECRLAQQFYGHRKVDYNREDSVTGYAWLARYTLEFLNAYLKDDAAARMFLKKAPVENGAPPRLMTVIHRPAVSTATLKDLQARIVQDGFDQISKVHECFRQEQPDCLATEMDFTAWAEALAEEGHEPEAVAVLELNAALHSRSGGAWLALAHAYRRTDDAAAAVEAYRRVRGLPPWWFGVVAAEWLRVLTGESN